MKRIVIYDSKSPNYNFHSIISLWRAFSAIPDVESRIANQQSIRFFLKNFNPEVVIVLGAEPLSVDSLAALKQSKVKSALWIESSSFESKQWASISEHFDIVFATEEESIAKCKHPRCYYLPLAADRELFYRPTIEDPDRLLYDLIFAGMWPHRIKFLKELIESLRKYKMRSRFILPTNLSASPETLEGIGLQKFEWNVRVSPGDLATLQNLSRFTLTLFNDFSDDYTGMRTSPASNLYETALAGTGQIFFLDNSDALKFDSKLEREIFQCSRVSEILGTLRQAKTSPEIRNQAANRTQRVVLDHHLYAHRAEEILRIVFE